MPETNATDRPSWRRSPSRRSVLKAAAWTAPTIALAVHAPAAAASVPPPADYAVLLSAYATGYSIDLTVTPAGTFARDGHIAIRIPRTRFLLAPVDYLASPWRNYSATLSNVHVAWAVRDIADPRVLRVQFPDNDGDMQGAGYEIWSADQQLMYSGPIPEVQPLSMPEPTAEENG